MDEVDRDARTKEMEEQDDKETVNRECATVQSNGKEYFMRPTHQCIVADYVGDVKATLVISRVFFYPSVG